ncbi:hypothetical protein GUJ93_ZPchr0007g3939 [Zizania palustris]|uniref:Uncharacterized protein n=1 Tax=Zizania palustris TaxID=103762 RepID=A0A8J5SLF3_ZIZPA|nr:hypothetical protein GUJ93_ZPchr0007g3939 [Zizania palustris]
MLQEAQELRQALNAAMNGHLPMVPTDADASIFRSQLYAYADMHLPFFQQLTAILCNPLERDVIYHQFIIVEPSLVCHCTESAIIQAEEGLVPGSAIPEACDRTNCSSDLAFLSRISSGLA